MIRLFLRLFNITDFEPCASCDTLKKQLEFANNERRELMETLIQLTKPTVVVPSAEVKTLSPLEQTGIPFRRRKGALENMLKKKQDIMANSPFIARVSENKVETPTVVNQDTIKNMEERLGLVDEEGE